MGFSSFQWAILKFCTNTNHFKKNWNLYKHLSWRQQFLTDLSKADEVGNYWFTVIFIQISSKPEKPLNSSVRNRANNVIYLVQTQIHATFRKIKSDEPRKHFPFCFWLKKQFNHFSNSSEIRGLTKFKSWKKKFFYAKHYINKSDIFINKLIWSMHLSLDIRSQCEYSYKVSSV